jgi:hypothetical protein
LVAFAVPFLIRNASASAPHKGLPPSGSGFFANGLRNGDIATQGWGTTIFRVKADRVSDSLD